ncbi:YdcF family protein [Solirubrobacter phytolaccae]|uniref:YdcF family protein n=1 Tax=Solirubrobacter phytolaccae TaxID=1404360 RepID=A0A9X3SJ94_9ACTN|nr:ElyC/SanA/YdcF family protein [Solirubrobacter phytolaccae]MDA0185012.1 YdcF family protein [Solirubrobacter phytolaccae]
MRRVLAIAVLLLAAVLVVPNAVVLLGGKGVADEPKEVPRAQAALVLGAQVMPNGAPSSMLSDRITAAAELYKAGRVDKLLLSGDHGRKQYDEVGTMRDILLKQGIPAEDIFTDHAGFDTWDSAQRAKRVFAAHSVVVVTQKFHMARALYDARKAGLDATGYAADKRDYGRVMPRLRVREAAARVKTVGDAVTGAEPHFLGPVIPITGDGRLSWG